MNTYTCAICATFNLDCHCDPSLDKLIIPEDAVFQFYGGRWSFPGELNPMFGKKRPDLIQYNINRKGKPFHTEETKHKISESQTGDKNHMFGNTHTKEVREKIANSGCNIGKWLGKKHTNNSKNKMRKPKHHGDTMREIRINEPKVICPHCHKSLDRLNANRWHFKNCKSRQQQQNQNLIS